MLFFCLFHFNLSNIFGGIRENFFIALSGFARFVVRRGDIVLMNRADQLCVICISRAPYEKTAIQAGMTAITVWWKAIVIPKDAYATALYFTWVFYRM